MKINVIKGVNRTNEWKIVSILINIKIEDINIKVVLSTYPTQPVYNRHIQFS